MSKAKTLLAALVACGLVSCVLGAPNASAAGLTAYVCQNVGIGNGEYKDSHCETTEMGGEYSTVTINQTTEVTFTATGNSLFKSKIGGVAVEISCPEMMSLDGAHYTNGEESGVMKVHGTNIVFDYGTCSALAGNAPNQKLCTVTGNGNAGTIRTVPLTATATAAGVVHHIVFEPVVGGTITEFTLGGPTCPAGVAGLRALKGKITGKVPPPAHSHITFSETVGGEFTLGAEPAEYSGTIHVVMTGTEETIGIKTS